MTFQKGDKVKVVRSGLLTSGRTGVVEEMCGKSVSVYIIGHGSIKYNPYSIKLINQNKGEDEIMMGNYTVCKVKFIEGTNVNKEYHYALYDNNICIDDYVVVKSANHGFGIARVVDIIPDGYVTQSMRDYCNEGREIISKFDMFAYEDRVEKRKKAKQLKADMHRKMKEMQELAMFEMMAEKNPELKEMLDQYKELVL